METSKVSDVIDTGELWRLAGLGVHVTAIHPEGRCLLQGLFNAIEQW